MGWAQCRKEGKLRGEVIRQLVVMKSQWFKRELIFKCTN